MRTLSLAGIYLAPVAAFTMVAGISGHSSYVVDQSDLAGESVLSELFEVGTKRPVDLALLDSVKNDSLETSPPATLVSKSSANSGEGQSGSFLFREGLFEISDLSGEAISAEFDSLIESNLPQTGFVASTKFDLDTLLGQTKALAPLIKNTSFAKVGAPFSATSLAGFGGTGSAGSSGFGPLPGSTAAVAAADPASSSSTPDATVSPARTAGIAAVPLPASASLLLVGFALLGALRLRKSS